jgi:hypothetical protein
LTIGFGHDSCCILASVLQHCEAVIDQLVDMDAGSSYDSKDTAHGLASTQPNQDAL